MKSVFRRGIFPFAIAFGALFAACVSTSLPVNANVRIYDMTVPGDVPPLQEDGGASYLVINLNPLWSQSVTKTIAITPAPPAGGGNSDLDFNSRCRDVKPANDPDGSCLKLADDVVAAVNIMQRAVQNFDTVAQFNARMAGLLETALGAYDSDGLRKSNQSVQSAAAAYAKWIRGTGTKANPTAGIDLTGITQDSEYMKLTSDTQTSLTSYQQITDLLAAKFQSRSDQKAKDVMADVSTIRGSLTVILGKLTSDLFAAGLAVKGTITQLQIQPTLAYYFVNVPCTTFGFSGSTTTVTFTQASGLTGTPAPASWTDTVTCYADLSVGAMYYYSGLSTESYTLVPNVTTPANMVAMKQSNLQDQGSISAVLNICSGGKPQGFCGAVALALGSTNAPGLAGLVGGGYLFAHRAVGVYTGLRVGPVSVLNNGITAGQTTIATGATFTHMETQANWFVGIALNFPASSK